MPLFHLTLQAVLAIHECVLAQHGGVSGLRDRNLLISALERSRATFGGRSLYPTLHEKAAALLESLCGNHPFVDGNKRVAYVATDVFMGMNGWSLAPTQDEIVEFMIRVAAGDVRKEEIRIWLEERSIARKSR
jgi:death-on-curing protein